MQRGGGGAGSGGGGGGGVPFEVGQTVKCTTANAEIMQGDVGKIVKVKACSVFMLIYNSDGLDM